MTDPDYVVNAEKRKDRINLIVKYFRFVQLCPGSFGLILNMLRGGKGGGSDDPVPSPLIEKYLVKLMKVQFNEC